jgi:hypothetical protein
VPDAAQDAPRPVSTILTYIAAGLVVLIAFDIVFVLLARSNRALGTDLDRGQPEA